MTYFKELEDIQTRHIKSKLYEFAFVNLETLVFEYIEKRMNANYVDKDDEHLIIEAAVELFFGRGIWRLLRDKQRTTRDTCIIP